MHISAAIFLFFVLFSYDTLLGQRFAHAGNVPSFSCDTAASNTEKTICSNETLARLDQQLNDVWRNFRDSFAGNQKMAKQLRESQVAWLASREHCGVNISCIANAYRKRLGIAGIDKKEHPFAGQYEAANIGSITIYPVVRDEYLIAINTADPKQGAWTCEIFGNAKGEDKLLIINAGGETMRAFLDSNDTLRIAPDAQALAVAQRNCGLNGTFSFTYHRVALIPSRTH